MSFPQFCADYVSATRIVVDTVRMTIVGASSEAGEAIVEEIAEVTLASVAVGVEVIRHL